MNPKYCVYHSIFFLFSVVVLGCSTPRKTSFPEQGIVEPYSQSGYVPSRYITPEYNLATELARVKLHYTGLKLYAAANKLSAQYIFVIDMRLPSYKKRFFVYNQKNDSLIATALVSHGVGTETYKGYLIFSNIPDSRMSSLGKYKIGVSYNGTYGFSYRLHGLDSTNNKALQRGVVIHSYPTVPNTERAEGPIVLSYGCPMVSPNFLQQLKGYISSQKKTLILLSIIY
jgi:L,D-transpeptidase catalytic domain